MYAIVTLCGEASFKKKAERPEHLIYKSYVSHMTGTFCGLRHYAWEILWFGNQ
jgi:hypothetical protein